jgi:hypothetical protein
MDGRIHLRSNIGINDDIEVHATSKELLVNQIYEYWASLANNAESPSLATGRSLSPPSTKLLVHWKRNRYRPVGQCVCGWAESGHTYSL